MKYNQPVALIFGSSSGIGYGVAEELIQNGYLVIITGKDKIKLLNAQKKLKAHDSFQLDLRNVNDVKNAIDYVIQKYNRIDVLVLNSAHPLRTQIDELNAEIMFQEFENILSIPIQAVQKVIPKMIEQNNGSVVWVSSIAASRVKPNLAASSIFRSAIQNTIHLFSLKYSQFGLRFNEIRLGYFDTEGLREAIQNTDQIIDQIPMKRLGLPSELGNMIVQISNQKMNYLNGQSIQMDGGGL